MRESQRTESNNERRSTLTGIIMTLAVHVAAFVLVSFTGLKYIYPPPEEQSMLIDFSVDMETVEQHAEDRQLDLAPYVDSEGNAYDYGFGLTYETDSAYDK